MNELIKSDLPDMNEMEMMMKYCEVISKAPAYASMGGMPGVFALVMSARELGIGMMTALNGGMYLIPAGIDKDGKPKGSPTIMMSAKTMSMMIWKCGHIIEEIEVSDSKVTLKGTRADNSVSMTVTMTMQKAKTAQLSHDAYGKPKLWSPWFKNTEDMLWKTCVAKLGRRLFTDVIGNAYEPAEFEEKENSDKKLALSHEKKQLKGKKIPLLEQKAEEISEKEEEIQVETEIKDFDNKEQKTEDNKISFEDFIDMHDIKNESTLIHKYILEISNKKGISFEECLRLSYENSKEFFNSFSKYEKANQ